MDLPWHALNSMIQVKTHCHIEEQGFGYLWLSKKSQTHPLKPAEAEPSFRKVNLLPTKLGRLFLLTSRLESFGHKSTPSHKPWTKAYYPKMG